MGSERKRCLVFGSAEISARTPITFLPDDIVICADGGLRHLSALDRLPDLLVGDMDSLDEAVLDGIPVERYPSEKDDTDTMIAVKRGLSFGCEEFFLYGCLGGRLDHTFANIQTLLYLEKMGKKAALLDGTAEIYVLSCGEIVFDAVRAGMISVFALSEKALGVYLEGLKYPLADAELTNDFPLGVSNEFIGKPSRISVKQGDLLLFLDQIEK